MAVTITKKFWNSTNSRFDDISKIVFTSPNIDSPAAAGTRSHILPGSEYIGTWHEAVDLMHRIRNNQDGICNPPTIAGSCSEYDQEQLSLDFNFGTDNVMTVLGLASNVSSKYVTTISGVYCDNNMDVSLESYGYVSSVTEYPYTPDVTTVETFVDVPETAYFDATNNPHYSLYGDGSTQIRDLIFSNVTISGSRYVYAIGNLGNYAWIHMYDTLLNQWNLKVEVLPVTLSSSYKSAYCYLHNTNKSYIIPGSNDTFWEYDHSADNWTNLSLLPVNPSSVYAISLVYIPSDHCFYYYTTTGSTIYKYEIDTDFWDVWEYSNPGNEGPTVYYGKSRFFWKVGDDYYIPKSGEGLTAVNVNSVSGTNTFTINSNYEISDFANIIYNIQGHVFYPSVTADSGIKIFGSFGNVFFGIEDNVSKTGVDSVGSPWVGVSGTLDVAGKSLTFTDEIRDTFFANVGGINDLRFSADGNGLFYIFNPNKADYLYSYNPVYESSIENLMVPGPWDGTLVSGTTAVYTKKYLSRPYVGPNTYTSNVIFLNDKIYTFASPYSSEFWVKNTTLDTWTRLAPYPYYSDDFDRYTSSKEHDCSCTDGTDIYKFRGLNSHDFLKYNVSGDSWTTLSGAPGIMGRWGDMVHVSGDIYVIQGEDSRSLWRYNIATDVWYDDLEDVPGGLFEKCKIGYPETGGNFIYVLKGDLSMYVYNIVTDSWSEGVDYPSSESYQIHPSSTRGFPSDGNRLYTVARYTAIDYYDVVSGTWYRDRGYELGSDTSYSDYDYDEIPFNLSSVGNPSLTIDNGVNPKLYIIGYGPTTVYSGTVFNVDLDKVHDPNITITSTTVSGNPFAYSELTLSNKEGTQSLLSGDDVFFFSPTPCDNGANAQNSVVFEVTNGEAYDCRLTAWDDDTHTTTSNILLSDEHYRVCCVAYRSSGGTKQSPTFSSPSSNLYYIHPPGVDIPLKGNTKYYGDFNLVHVAEPTTDHGEYLIFASRLADMDESIPSGNYDFVTTLHFQYT